jgi:DNA-binding MarR family transcriptional regulator
MKLIKLAELMFDLIPLMDYKFVRPVDIKFRSSITQAQMHILSDLQKNDMTMKELAENMMVSKQQMTIIIDKLVKNHYVIRKTAPEDRRVIVIAITQNAIDLLSSIKAFSLNILKIQMNVMNKEDQEILANAALQLHSVISKYK